MPLSVQKDWRIESATGCSLVCMCHGTSLDHCHPSIAHIQWDYRPVVRRITQWANSIALGKEDIWQGYIKAKMVEGGAVGKAPK